MSQGTEVQKADSGEPGHHVTLFLGCLSSGALSHGPDILYNIHHSPFLRAGSDEWR